jgi:Ca2+-binding EF-hand superfamily protein
VKIIRCAFVGKLVDHTVGTCALRDPELCDERVFVCKTFGSTEHPLVQNTMSLGLSSLVDSMKIKAATHPSKNISALHRMTLDELLEILKQKSRSRANRDVDVSNNLNFLLRRFDLNGNGLIDVNEFRATLKRSFALTLPKSTCSRLYRKLGPDKNGEIKTHTLADAILHGSRVLKVKREHDDGFVLSLSVSEQNDRKVAFVDANMAGGIKKQARKRSTHYVEGGRYLTKGSCLKDIIKLISTKISSKVNQDSDLVRVYTNFFRKADLSDRGEITQNQLNDCLRRFFALNLAESQVSELFHFLDVNNDKAVSRVEFIQGFLGNRGLVDKHVRLHPGAHSHSGSSDSPPRPSTGWGGEETSDMQPDSIAFFSKLASAATSLAAAAGVKPRLFLLEKLASMGCRDRLSMNDIRQLLVDWGVNTMSLGKIATALKDGECFVSEIVGGEYAWKMGKLHVKVVDTHLMLELVERQLRYCPRPAIADTGTPSRDKRPATTAAVDSKPCNLSEYCRNLSRGSRDTIVIQGKRQFSDQSWMQKATKIESTAGRTSVAINETDADRFSREVNKVKGNQRPSEGNVSQRSLDCLQIGQGWNKKSLHFRTGLAGAHNSARRLPSLAIRQPSESQQVHSYFETARKT